jgi:hypothetical protein
VASILVSIDGAGGCVIASRIGTRRTPPLKSLDRANRRSNSSAAHYEQFLETPWCGARQMARHLRRQGWCVGSATDVEMGLARDLGLELLRKTVFASSSWIVLCISESTLAGCSGTGTTSADLNTEDNIAGRQHSLLMKNSRSQHIRAAS